MIIPTPRTLLALALGAVPAALPLWMGDTLPWLIYLAILISLLVISILLTRRFADSKASVVVPDVLYVGSEDTISFTVSSSLPFVTRARVRLETVGVAEWQPLTSLGKLFPGENLCTYRVKPLRRGLLTLHSIIVRIEDFLGMWEIERRLSLAKSVKVFPNVRAVGRYAINFIRDPHARSGLKVEKYRGEGSEFDSLREYLPGFDIRTLDWKASARKGKLVCREFRAEKNHEVILALDSGRLMAAEFQGLTKLDYAINSLLIIAYLALKTGDRVGFLSFDHKVLTFLMPQAQMSVVQQISSACTGLSYEFGPTNYVVPIEYLLVRQKKRALIIILTDFTDAVSAELMKDYLFLLSQRHLILFIAVRDPFLSECVRAHPSDLMDLHKKVACYNLEDERVVLFQELRRMGIHCLDLTPDNISVPVVNKYLEIRRKELI